MIAPTMPPIGKNPGNKKPATNSANDADDDIANEAETAACHDLTGKPTSDRTDERGI